MKAIRTILACIRAADSKYNLINHGDKIVVGLSGGKDSLALVYALSLYQKFSHTDFVIQPVTLDLGFPNFNPEPLKEFCASLGLNLIVNDSKDVYKILLANQDNDKHLPCSICSKMKKAAINKVANELGFNKVAFAHHADDAIETLFLNQIYGARIATFSPKMFLERANMTFIRPFIMVREKDIKKLIKEENINVIPSACPADKHTSREVIKNTLENIYKTFPESKNNFLTMLDNYSKEDLWGQQIELQVNQNGLYLKPVTTPIELLEAVDIRHEVFCVEQNIDYKDEVVLEEEHDVNTYLIKLKGVSIGTIRYRKTDKGIKLERFAIKKDYRGHSYGKEVFIFLFTYLSAQYNPCLIYFNAQYQLLDYYTSMGYLPVGEPFIEANIKHIEMQQMFKK